MHGLTPPNIATSALHDTAAQISKKNSDSKILFQIAKLHLLYFLPRHPIDPQNLLWLSGGGETGSMYMQSYKVRYHIYI